MPLDHDRIAAITGAASIARIERLQSVWSGYGDILRVHLVGAAADSVIAKHVQPPKGRGRSHDRKLRSYDVERAFYTRHAERCGDACRVPRCLHAERARKGWLFVFEDLDSAGFPGRTRRPNTAQVDACLRWLAAFHATFLDERPRGIWKVGTYWHLATRPDELNAMPRGPLRDAAAAIDARLSAATFQTWVHGDAKPANFCFPNQRGSKVAALDFQYVGRGVGIKDVVYLLSMSDAGAFKRGVDVYFDALRLALASGKHEGIDVSAIESEWRELVPWAWADFQRFLEGWSPGWRVERHEAAMTRDVLTQLGKGRLR